MSKINGFRIFQDNKSLLENIEKSTHSFDIDKLKEYSEYEPFNLIENAFDTGSKILKNFPSIGQENKNTINKVINKDIFDDIKALDISTHLEEVKPYLEEFKNKYNFPVLEDKDYTEFSEQLILFALMYSFNRDLILISHHRANTLYTESSKVPYIEDELNPRIDNFNHTGIILFNKFEVIDLIDIKDLNVLLDRENKFMFYPTKYKGMLLTAVNEFSYRYSYSISSFINVQSRCVNITSNKVFNLIWHIFVNFVLADTLPSKITFCKSCGAMIENTTKIRKLCNKCEDKSKNRKKVKKKK